MAPWGKGERFPVEKAASRVGVAGRPGQALWSPGKPCPINGALAIGGADSCFDHVASRQRIWVFAGEWDSLLYDPETESRAAGVLGAVEGEAVDCRGLDSAAGSPCVEETMSTVTGRCVTECECECVTQGKAASRCHRPDTGTMPGAHDAQQRPRPASQCVPVPTHAGIFVRGHGLNRWIRRPRLWMDPTSSEA